MNLFRQRGSIAAVVRVIRFGLPTAEEAHIPPEVMRAAQMKKRHRARYGLSGQR